MNEKPTGITNYLPEQVFNAFDFHNYSFLEITCLLTYIRLNMTKSFLGNTKKTNKNSVIEQNTQ